MTKARKPAWPKELGDPIIIKTAPAAFGSLAPGGSDDDQLRAEMQRRVGLIAKQVQSKSPTVWNDEWAVLLFKVCDYWAIPAVIPSSAKRGQAKLWTDQKLCELFGDVQALKKSNGRLSELGACKFIAKNAAQFGKRYLRPRKTQPDAWALTLHRQYMTVKKKIQNDHLFWQINLADGVAGILNGVTSNPDLSRVAIERFAFTRNKGA